MSNRFTQRAQQVIFLAEQVARNLHCSEVDTGHLLWGILREGNGIGAAALASLGVDITALENELPRGNVMANNMEATPDLKRALQMARDEAAAMGVNYIGTEHLLLGLLRESDGFAARWLHSHTDVSANQVRQLIYDILQQGGVAMPPQGTASGEGGGAKGQSKTPTLDEFGRDLTELAKKRSIGSCHWSFPRNPTRYPNFKPSYEKQSSSYWGAWRWENRYCGRLGPKNRFWPGTGNFSE